jgi:carbon-monoxide dehydrogenase medium subunit
MAMLNLRYAMPDDLVDLNRIDGLAGVSEAGGTLRIGAMTRQRALERDALLAARAPVFREALLQVGHIQTRNRGTIGGSLCHLDPAAELPAVCMLHDAEVLIAGPEGQRRLPMADFPAFYMTPALEPGEILTGIEIAPWAPGAGHAFVEFARRHGDFAIVAAGCLIERAADGTVARAAVVLGGVGAAPLRLTAAEAVLRGQLPDVAALAAAAAHAEGIEAMDDGTYSADYRRHLARVLTGRALALAAERSA